jgi:hypothetical protein
MGCILIWIFGSEEHNTCRAGYCPFEHAFLGGASRIINEVREINRLRTTLRRSRLGRLSGE